MQALARPVYSQPPENALTVSPLGPLGVTLAVGSFGGGTAALCTAPHGLSLGSYACLSMAFLQSGPAAPLVSPPPTPPAPTLCTHIPTACLSSLSPSTILTCWPFAGWDPHRYRYHGLSGQQVGPLVCWEVRRVQLQGVEGSWQAAHAGDSRPHPLVQTSPPWSQGASQLCKDNSWGSGSAKRNSWAMWFPGQKGPFTPIRLACFCCLVFGDGPKDKSFLPQPPSA